MIGNLVARPRTTRAYPACAALARHLALLFCALCSLKLFIDRSPLASSSAAQSAHLGGGGSINGGRAAQLEVDQAPLLAGPQQKSGPLGVLTQLAQVTDDGPEARETLYYPQAWVTERLRGSKRPPPARVGSILISSQYKVIFVKCTKTAGTSFVKSFFRLAGCFVLEAASCPVLRIVDYSSAAAVQHALEAYKDYFVFTFVRNVMRRAVSQYQYPTTLMDPDCPALSWDQYCEDPYSPAGRPCCVPNPQHHYQHASPQAHCPTTAEGGLAVDWVGRVEAFAEDLVALVDLLNARPGVPQLLRPAELDPPLARLNYNAAECQEGDGEEEEEGGGQEQLGPGGSGSAGSSAGHVGRGGGDVTIRISIKDSSSSGGGSDGGSAAPSSRRLRFFSTTPRAGGDKLPLKDWQPRRGMLNPCDKNRMLQGRHAHCYTALTHFYGEDMRLLHGAPG